MRRVGRFVVLTVVQGILFLAPIVLVTVVAREAFGILRKLFEPIARLVPREGPLAMMTADLLTLTALGLVFLIAGLFVATRPGRSLSDRLERTVLYRVPGYLLVRGAVGGFPGLESEKRAEPVLVEGDDGWAFGLLVERAPAGYCTVFLPDSPTPTSGSVRIVEEGRVRLLDASMLALLGCLTRSGSGAGALAERVLAVVAEERGSAASVKA